MVEIVMKTEVDDRGIMVPVVVVVVVVMVAVMEEKGCRSCHGGGGKYYGDKSAGGCNDGVVRMKVQVAGDGSTEAIGEGSHFILFVE